jgi:hypothetical protein
MADWFNSEWTIKASHVLAVVEIPPPPPAALGEFTENPDVEVSQEVIEDLATAEQALDDYATTGIGDTSPYSEYRARRLGTDS